jgi:uncharacterized integral membrane protein
MRYVSLAIKLMIFAVLLGFAFKNSAPVTLSYWFGYELTAPLVLILMGFLGIGIVIGLLASLGSMFRLRRQVQSLKKELKLQAATPPAVAAPTPQAPVPATTPAPVPEHPVA